MDSQNKEIVIFDTNAYRYLTQGKSFDQVEKTIRKFKEKEAEKGIVALMNSIVVEELLAHVAEPSDSSHEICVNALKGLYLHCGNNESFSMFPDIDVLIAKLLFNYEMPERVEQQETLGHLAYLIAKEETSKVLRKFPHQFKQVKRHVNETEELFVSATKEMIKAYNKTECDSELFPDNPEMKKKIKDHINSTSVSMEIGLAWVFETIQRITNQPIPLTPEYIKSAQTKYSKFIEDFCAPIELWKEVLRRHIYSDFNMSNNNRANFVWDIHLMFSVTKLSMQGSKVYFVTADKAILNAAEKCGLNLSILTFDEYIEYLNS